MIHHGRFEDVKVQDHNWMLPLRQVATYCSKTERRYGYLITDQELVVIRITKTSSKSKSVNVLEYRSISWNGDTTDGMTMNLALWLLHMLANYTDSSL